ncbi:type II toxin-antitoxin system RelE/ParE family toxin [Serratia sp. PAMC26656]|uniref:type II toxin-antitoxin system RelE/ParE family toxin n=1 Tax=Serratia sp. PAMC26656 TaxID=2775909 RepID=UPI0018F6BC0C|nr:type II toxin-antitoxin system RelE/ParE family toxin [Serratia sp. PAMC26656]MBJ7892978.1 type II toxin-antitoxin system RelE/ParE family toxin [Serratia sp. PAMC26656]
MRAFKTKWFAKKASAHGIADIALCEAIQDIQRGLAIDLGGGVFKKRLNCNRERALVLAKSGDSWVYTFLFAKQDRAGISTAELQTFRKLAAQYDQLSVGTIATLIEQNEWVEICHEKKSGFSQHCL